MSSSSSHACRKTLQHYLSQATAARHNLELARELDDEACSNSGYSLTRTKPSNSSNRAVGT